MGIAERLLAGYVAVDQTEIARVPTEIFAVKLGIIDGDVLTFPKSVLGGDFSVVDLDVAGILEHIFAVADKSVDSDTTAKHEGVGSAVEVEILDSDVLAAPESFVSIIDDYIFDVDACHFAKHFGSVNHRVGHFQVRAIP